MDSNLSYFSLPFVDVQDLDFGKIRGQDCEYDDLHPTLPHGSLLGADDDVLAQFLSGDDPLEEPDLNGPTTLHCEICRKHFDNAKKYYGHLRVHSKDNLWKCDKCPNEKFSTKQQLMKHSLTHQPLERVWRCPQCEMSFEALWRLQQHLFAKHLDYRPHKCELCPKTFHKLSDLDKHKDVHAAVKKHACTVCQRKFTDKSNLKRHMLCHGDEKAYTCVGCGHRYKQLASLHSHSKKCAMAQKNPAEPKKSYRNNHCRVCGMTFKYKSSLLEHCVREHSNNPSLPPPAPPKEDKSNQLHVDTNRTVDKIVDDILSAEDDYMTMSTQNDLINYPEVNQLNQDNLMQIELLKEMNQIHNIHDTDIYDDELLYNDIDIDSFQTMCNNIDYERNDLFDLNDARSIDHIMNGKSLDQDLMNALVRGIDQVKDDIPKDYLNQPEINVKVNEFLNPPVSVNDCSTIFESDVDLEASTNLAANLNQLIGENNVQYISTEYDDTFIISLNSEIDAEQLTDMLNIGMENKPFRTGDGPEQPEVVNKDLDNKDVDKEEKSTKKIKPEKKGRMKTKYICLKCKKVFNKKDNYISHRGTHDIDVKEYECEICSERFSYKSSLNKHTRKVHTPSVKTPHTCLVCNKICETAYQLKKHKVLNHKLIHPYQCDIKDCEKNCFSKWDLDIHKKSHSEEKPYACDICSKTYKTRSHLTRHIKKVDCTKRFEKPKLVLSSRPERLKMASKEQPIINLYVCDSSSTNKKEAKAKKPKIDASQEDKPASNLLLLPLKFVRKKPKKMKLTKQSNPKSLLKAPNNFSVERNESKKIKIVKNHKSQNVNRREGTVLAESKIEINIENEKHSDENESRKINIIKDETLHNVNVEKPSSWSTRAGGDGRLQKVLNMEDLNLVVTPNSKIEMYVENEQQSESKQIRNIEIIKDEKLQKLKIKETDLDEMPKIEVNTENVKHSDSPIESKKIQIIKDERLQKALSMKRSILFKTDMNVNKNVHNLQKSKTKIEKVKDETLRKKVKIGRPIVVTPLNTIIKINSKKKLLNSERNEINKLDIVKDERLQMALDKKSLILAESLNSNTEMNVGDLHFDRNKTNKIKIIKDELLQKELTIGRPVLDEPLSKLELNDKRNIEIVQNSERNDDTIQVKNERLHKIINIKRPALATSLNSKIVMNVNSRTQNETNKNKKIHIIKDETLRIVHDKEGNVLVNPLNSKIDEAKQHSSNDISLTKFILPKIEPKNLKTDKIQIKTLNGTFIIEPLNLQLEQNKFETTKTDETKSKAPKGSIVMEPRTSQLNQHNEVINTEVIKLQTPKTGSLVIKTLSSKKENSTEHEGIIRGPNFRMERIKPMSLDVEQSKSKSLFVTNKSNSDNKQNANLKIKIITSIPTISEENKVKTPNGNFVVTSNSNMMTMKGNGLKIASFLRQKLKTQPIAAQKS